MIIENSIYFQIMIYHSSENKKRKAKLSQNNSIKDFTKIQ